MLSTICNGVMIVDRDMQLKAKVCYSQPIQSSIANNNDRDNNNNDPKPNNNDNDNNNSFRKKCFGQSLLMPAPRGQALSSKLRPNTPKPNNNDNDNNTSFGKNGLVQSLQITQFID